MGYTYHKKNNTLTIDSSTGLVITDLYNKAMKTKGKKFNVYKYNWQKGALCGWDQGVFKHYSVFFSKDNKDYPIMIKVDPANKYHDAKFEGIFNLGCHCANWDPHTTIGLSPNQKGTVNII
jgi:hypothetical protein